VSDRWQPTPYGRVMISNAWASLAECTYRQTPGYRLQWASLAECTYRQTPGYRLQVCFNLGLFLIRCVRSTMMSMIIISISKKRKCCTHTNTHTHIHTHTHTHTHTHHTHTHTLPPPPSLASLEAPHGH
jgi:hypothetical protein